MSPSVLMKTIEKGYDGLAIIHNTWEWRQINWSISFQYIFTLLVACLHKQFKDYGDYLCSFPNIIYEFPCWLIVSLIWQITPSASRELIVSFICIFISFASFFDKKPYLFAFYHWDLCYTSSTSYYWYII